MIMKFLEYCWAESDFIWEFLDKVHAFSNPNQHIRLNQLYGNLGTALRVLSRVGNLQALKPNPVMYQIKTKRRKRSNVTPPPHEFEPEICNFVDNNKEAHMFHSVLKMVGKAFNSNVSLYDIPKLFNPRIPPSDTFGLYNNYRYNHDNFPTYTLCKIAPSMFRDKSPSRTDRLSGSGLGKIIGQVESYLMCHFNVHKIISIFNS